MPKTAFLVSFWPMTRVIVDVENPGALTDDDYVKLAAAAKDRILREPSSYLNYENLDFDGTKEDIEVPYNPKDDDN